MTVLIEYVDLLSIYTSCYYVATYFAYNFKQAPTPDANTNRGPGAFPTAAKLLPYLAPPCSCTIASKIVCTLEKCICQCLCEYAGKMGSDIHPWIC